MTTTNDDATWSEYDAAADRAEALAAMDDDDLTAAAAASIPDPERRAAFLEWVNWRYDDTPDADSWDSWREQYGR